MQHVGMGESAAEVLTIGPGAEGIHIPALELGADVVDPSIGRSKESFGVVPGVVLGTRRTKGGTVDAETP
jgi:hypothetical protein